MKGGVPTRIDLPVEGMSCASCASRIERKLNRLDGVHATVNYATERATVEFDPALAGKELIADTIEQTGYHAVLDTAGRSETAPDEATSQIARRMWASAAMTVPVLALAMIPRLQFDGWQWFSLVLTTIVVGWGGLPFHRAALTSVRHGAATMDTLISVGTLAALGWSVVAMLFLGAGALDYRMSYDWTLGAGGSSDDIYLEVAAVVTTFVLTGRYFESRAKRRAGAALRALLELGAKEVSLIEDGRERRVPVEQLRVGDLFAVRPGERVATDGVVIEGRSAIDRSLLTGESIPVEVGPGDNVAGATVNAGGMLTVRATAVGADTALAQIGRLVVAAQSGKAEAQRLADRVSAVFVPIVIALSLAALAYWLLEGAGAGFAFQAAVAVLIVACPCALGLATPTALLVGTGRGAQLGILIKGPEVLEQTRTVTTIVLDKTGTITEGRMSVAEVLPAPGVESDELLRLAGAARRAATTPCRGAVGQSTPRRKGRALCQWPARPPAFPACTRRHGSRDARCASGGASACRGAGRARHRRPGHPRRRGDRPHRAEGRRQAGQRRGDRRPALTGADAGAADGRQPPHRPRRRRGGRHRALCRRGTAVRQGGSDPTASGAGRGRGDGRRWHQ